MIELINEIAAFGALAVGPAIGLLLLYLKMNHPYEMGSTND